MTDIDAIILAGGEGNRMGGVNKGLVDFNGKPLITHVINRIRPQVNNIFISANQNHEEYRSFGFAVISDSPEFTLQGPLAGIESCLPNITTSRFLICCCDTPRLPLDLVARLATTTSEGECSVAVINNRQENLFALWPSSIVQSLRDYLRSGQRSVHGFYQQQGFSTVEFTQASDFTNINTPKDLLSP